jgi:uncharacterized protein YoxC
MSTHPRTSAKGDHNVNQIGKVAILVALAFVIVYVPVKYFQHGSATKAELDAAVKECNAVKQSLDAANRTIESANAQLNDRQKALNERTNDLQKTKQDLTAQVQQLTAKLQQLESEKSQLARPSVSPEDQTTESKFVMCPWCGGDFKNKTVICKREHGFGCDGKGYCVCPDCQGKRIITCSNCAGTGKVTILTQSGGGLRQGQGSHLEPCNICHGQGRIDCSKCGTLCVRVPNADEQFLDPIISQEDRGSLRQDDRRSDCPKGQSTFLLCGRTLVVKDHYRDWVRVTGAIVCPKCSGRGKVRVKGVCEHCTEGQIERSKLPSFLTGLPPG